MVNKRNLDNLSQAEEIHSDKGYQESTLEKVEEFARKRNYQYEEYQEGFYDVGNLSLEEIKRRGRE